MIAYLSGTVLKVRKDRIVLLCGSIGYEVYLPQALSKVPGEKLELWTYQQFREDGQSLYGFESEQQYELFVLLIQVKGLGCKSVMNMLSAMPVESIAQAIEEADAGKLKKLPGIGAKTAGQIILDLKGKVVVESNAASLPASSGNPVWDEVALALESLGYKPAELAGVAAEMKDNKDMQVDEMLRKCLKQLSGKLHFQSNA